jgi:4-hydroxybenzoyl-CoA reductase subunit beta
MRALPPLSLHRPANVAEAAALLARLPGARLVGGGTDLLPNLRRGLGAPPALVDLSAVAELQDLQALDDGGLVVGAGVTLARLAGDAQVALRWPALAEAARSVAASGHRSAATVGGNLCQDTRCVFYNQSEWWRASNGFCLKRGGTRCHVAPQGERCHAAFCSDLAPVLLAANAEVDLQAAGAARSLPLAALYRDDGAAHLALAPGEVLARVRLPPAAAGMRLAFGKMRSRGGIDFPLASAAVAANLHDGRVTQLRVAISGTNSLPVVLAGTADLADLPLEQAAASLRTLVQRQVSPMRSSAMPANHRRDVAVALVLRLLRECAEPA